MKGMMAFFTLLALDFFVLALHLVTNLDTFAGSFSAKEKNLRHAPAVSFSVFKYELHDRRMGRLQVLDKILFRIYMIMHISFQVRIDLICEE